MMHSDDSSYQVFEVPVFAPELAISDVCLVLSSLHAEQTLPWLSLGVFVQVPAKPHGTTQSESQVLGIVPSEVLIEALAKQNLNINQPDPVRSQQKLLDLVTKRLPVNSKKPKKTDLLLHFFENEQDAFLFKEPSKDTQNSETSRPFPAGMVDVVKLITKDAMFNILVKDYYLLQNEKSQHRHNLLNEVQSKYLQELEIAYALTHIRLNSQELARQFEDNHFVTECRKRISHSAAIINFAITPSLRNSSANADLASPKQNLQRESDTALSEVSEGTALKPATKIAIGGFLNGTFSDLQMVLTSEGHGLILDVSIEGYLLVNQLQLSRALQLLVLACRKSGLIDFSVIARQHPKQADSSPNIVTSDIPTSSVTISIVADDRQPLTAKQTTKTSPSPYLEAALAFATNVVTEHQGTITHTFSELKQLIEINLPVYESLSYHLAVPSADQSGMDVKAADTNKPRRRALVVDDDIDVQNYMTAILTDMGFETFSANDGFDGLLIVERFSPEFVFTDLRMPKLNGIEFLKKINNPLRPCTKVLMTGISTDFLRTELMAYASDYVIAKPITVDQILQIVTSISATRA